MSKVSDYWLRQIEEAQRETHVCIGAKLYARVPYPHDAYGRCPDCITRPGKLHVISCDQERCPVCGGQAISCECDMEAPQ